MDLSHIVNGGLILSKGDCDQLTKALSGVNAMLDAIHRHGLHIIENSSSTDPEVVAGLAAAIQAMAMVGCRKVDAVARALGEVGFGNFEEEFAPIVLGAGEGSDED